MDTEDDMVIFVVNKDGYAVEENDCDYISNDVNVKLEPVDVDDEQLEELQNMINLSNNYDASRIKDEPEDCEIQYLEDEFVPNSPYSDGDDAEYNPNMDEEESDDDKRHAGTAMLKAKMRKKANWRVSNPNSWRSFVKQLCTENPGLRDNVDDLINALVSVMYSVQAPKLEDDYYRDLDSGCYQCKICDFISLTKPVCDRHFLEKHGPRYLICFACGADFRSTTNLYKHEKRCLAPDATIVLRARARFLGNRARNRIYSRPQHVADGTKRFMCKLCPAAFKVKTSLISHERMHRAERPFQCDLCACAYTSKAVLSKHMWTHKNINFVCDHCGLTFKHKTALVSHVFTHSEPRFKCMECTRAFTYKAALQLHVHRKHRNLPLPCACQICPKRFGRMWALKDHMKKAHGMLLMTRTMFFKQLPTMSETEINQAKVVLRSEVPILNPSDIKIDEMKEYKYKTIKRNTKRKVSQGVLDCKTGKLVYSDSEQEFDNPDDPPMIDDFDEDDEVDNDNVSYYDSSEDVAVIVQNEDDNEDSQLYDGHSSQNEDSQLYDGQNEDSLLYDGHSNQNEDSQLYDGQSNQNEDSQLYDGHSSQNEDSQLYDGHGSQNDDRQLCDGHSEDVADIGQNEDGQIYDREKEDVKDNVVKKEVIEISIKCETDVKCEADDQDNIRIVVMDDTDVDSIDYGVLLEHMNSSAIQEYNGSKIIFIADGEIKFLSQEKIKELVDKIIV